MTAVPDTAHAPDSQSRAAILDAAQRLFAAQGFPATTIKQIGAEAGVNSALLYYYFADKETLYRAVLHRIIGAFVGTGLRAFDASDSPVDAIRAVVTAQTEFMTARPEVPRLIARELVDHEAAHATEDFTHLAANLFSRLCETIRDGQRAGIFRDDLDPQFAAISTVAQVVYFHIARPAVGILLGLGRGGVPAATARAFGAHAADFAIAALSAVAAPATRPVRSRGAVRKRRPSRPKSTPARPRSRKRS
jgi:TetR/AcrR family transcriptional regulator